MVISDLDELEKGIKLINLNFNLFQLLIKEIEILELNEDMEFNYHNLIFKF